MLVKLGLPAGSLQESTFDLLRKAGWPVSVGERSYYPDLGDPELDAILLRPQEMSRYVEQGALDAGIAGRDWVEENESEVVTVEELVYAKYRAAPVRWVLAVPESSGIRSVADLQGKTIATELVGRTKKWLAEKGVEAKVEFSWGATEVKPPDLADAIVDVTETGSSLRANRLREIETVCESVTLLIANSDAWKDAAKRQKLENLGLLLQGAIVAREKVGLKMNVPADKLEAVISQLPSLRRPTVSPLSGEGWCAIEVMVDEATVRELIPELKRAGAEGIIEYPLNKVIP